MMTHKVETGEKPCKIVMVLQARGTISFVGRCLQTQDCYFARQKSIFSTQRLEFPMPISPKTLEIIIKGNCKLKELRVEPLPPPKMKLDAETYAFIQHVFEFCKKFPRISTGIYTDRQGRFPIVLSEKIRNRDTGKPSATPARVSRTTGQIEVSREKFKRYTVPMRVFILLHERSHYALQTSNELECDLQALQWYLGFGFPQTEAIYANTKIFSGNNPEHNDRAEQIVDYVKHYNYQTATYDNGFCKIC